MDAEATSPEREETRMAPPRRRGATLWALWLSGLAFIVGTALERWWDLGFPGAMGLSREGLAQGRFWQPLTYMFIHRWEFVPHILANLFFLYFLGSTVEGALGAARFWLLFIGGGLVAVPAYLLLGASPALQPVEGATASVCAVAVAAVIAKPAEKHVLLRPVEVRYLAPIAIVITTYFSFLALREWGWSNLVVLSGCVWGAAYATWHQPLEAALSRIGKHVVILRKRSPAELEAEVDRILLKISRHGVDSLTPQERKFLDKHSRHKSE